MRTRSFVVVGLLVALVLAGVGSYYASSLPDGLEYVAERTGFADNADDHAAADGPLADYRVDGIEDERVSGGLAGVVGALVVLLLTGGLTLLLRRRGRGPDPVDHPEPADQHAADQHQPEGQR